MAGSSPAMTPSLPTQFLPQIRALSAPTANPKGIT
jgi:hypothetical protein